MKTLLAAALLVVSLSSTVLAAEKDELKVLGFSPDAKYFGFVTYGIHDGSGFPHAELNVFDVAKGKRDEKLSQKVELQEGATPGGNPALEKLEASTRATLEKLQLTDTGVELYKSGTATKTTFTLDGMERKLEVKRSRGKDSEGMPKEQIQVVLSGNGSKRTVFSGGGGFDYSLNSVRLSNGNRALGIFLKYSSRGFEGPDRHYLFVPVKL